MEPIGQVSLNLSSDSQPRSRLSPECSEALGKWLAVIAEHYPQHGDVTELAVIGYVEGLRELTSKEMDIGFSVALKTCKFRPTAADVIEGLRQYRQSATAAPPSEETKSCASCQGSGYKVVKRTDGNPGNWAVKCDHKS
jgi:hypothetical protein